MERPQDDSGYSASDLITLGFVNSPNHVKLVEDTRALTEISVQDYDTVFTIGGQAPMYTRSWGSNGGKGREPRLPRQTLLPEAGNLQQAHVTDQTGEFGA